MINSSKMQVQNFQIVEGNVDRDFQEGNETGSNVMNENNSLTAHAVPADKADHGRGQNYCSYLLAKQSAIKPAPRISMFY